MLLSLIQVDMKLSVNCSTFNSASLAKDKILKDKIHTCTSFLSGTEAQQMIDYETGAPPHPQKAILA